MRDVVLSPCRVNDNIVVVVIIVVSWVYIKGILRVYYGCILGKKGGKKENIWKKEEKKEKRWWY